MVDYLVLVAVFGSPVWTSAAVIAVRRRWGIWAWLLEGGLVCLQGAIALFLWWFFWGGGIGGEAHLPPASQWLGLVALLPVITVAAKHIGRGVASPSQRLRLTGDARDGGIIPAQRRPPRAAGN